MALVMDQPQYGVVYTIKRTAVVFGLFVEEAEVHARNGLATHNELDTVFGYNSICHS